MNNAITIALTLNLTFSSGRFPLDESLQEEFKQKWLSRIQQPRHYSQKNN